MPDQSEAEQTQTLGTAGFARIRRAPLAFLDLLALNYQSLWTAGTGYGIPAEPRS